ncbi:MAG: hypothetical protein ACRERE_33305 [Candidatus Entotheonellia bacterium]
MEEKTSPPASLPDINAETYPFEVVQYLLDQAAYFTMFSTPDSKRSNAAILTPGQAGGVIGIKVDEILHRFGITIEPPTPETGLKAVNVVGEPAGTFSHRWMFIPHDFTASPDREPPPTLLEPLRSQRFVMLEGVCTFGEGKDGFHGFGTGLTYPVTMDGRRQLLAAAIGNIMEGFGKFKNLEGTYTYCGTLTPEQGFQGNLTCRVMDPSGILHTTREIPPMKPIPNPEPGVTYILFRGEKRDKAQKTAYSFGTDGQVNGLNVEQQLRIFHLDFTSQGHRGLCTMRSVGEVIGKMTSRILFNLFNPGAPGTAVAPIPFSAYNEFTFFDRERRVVGSFVGDGSEGRTFNMELSGAPGQQTLRFGGVGPLLKGTGCFRGLEGLMTDNSVVGVAPHVTSTLYVLCIIDPDGKYRAGFNEATPQRSKKL